MTAQIDMFDDRPLPMLVQRACQLLVAHQPKDQPYFGCFSGGKDSVVIKELARMAGVNVKWHYHVTTIDPPELVRFIKREHPDVTWDKPRHGNLFRRVEHKGLPTRLMRWCCSEYKEGRGPKGCTRILGVRTAESRARAGRYTACVMDAPARRINVYPIRLWSDEQVWKFIRETGISYCDLYDQGFTRLGCVGCPLANKSSRLRELDRWPGFAKQWKLSAGRFLDQHRGKLRKDGTPFRLTERFGTVEEYWEWWIDEKRTINP